MKRTLANLGRLFAGLLLLPCCWALTRVLLDAVPVAAGTCGAFSVEVLSLLGGIVAFILAWMTLSHPVKTYVLGHELTHALWGLLFGACPSDVRVSASGGSVKLTKSNVFITLAPYFFPFYTFLVIVAALITTAFWKPLPCLPLWLFLIGFTWAFHVLFTLETLTQRQPDVKLYGRIFSWTFIYSANLALVLVWLACATDLTFAELGGFAAHRAIAAYTGLATGAWAGIKWLKGVLR